MFCVLIHNYGAIGYGAVNISSSGCNPDQVGSKSHFQRTDSMTRPDLSITLFFQSLQYITVQNLCRACSESGINGTKFWNLMSFIDVRSSVKVVSIQWLHYKEVLHTAFSSLTYLTQVYRCVSTCIIICAYIYTDI